VVLEINLKKQQAREVCPGGGSSWTSFLSFLCSVSDACRSFLAWSSCCFCVNIDVGH